MRYDQRGASAASLLGFVTMILIVSLVFGGWAFQSRQQYKNDVDQKIAAAVQVAVQQTKTADAQGYATESLNPFKTYNGPAPFGSVVLQYPKDWSAYVSEIDSNSTPINAYFQPGVVPDVGTPTNSFAFRLQVINQPYDQEISQLTGNGGNVNGATVSAYALPKLPNIVGIEISGQIPNDSQKTGEMVALPERDQTILLWTESSQFLSNFNTMLSTFTFAP